MIGRVVWELLEMLLRIYLLVCALSSCVLGCLASLRILNTYSLYNCTAWCLLSKSSGVRGRSTA